jgi:hypothetical protein
MIASAGRQRQEKDVRACHLRGQALYNIVEGVVSNQGASPNGIITRMDL